MPDDPEVPLDLQAVFRAAYEPSRYDRRLPYEQPLLPPLPPKDEAWVRQRLLPLNRGETGGMRASSET